MSNFYTKLVSSFRTQWIYDASDIIYPSVYMNEQIRPADRPSMVRGRVREAVRLAKQSRSSKKPQVLAYFRYVFTDTKQYLSEVCLFICMHFNNTNPPLSFACQQRDILNSVAAIRSSGGDGVILWGSSYDLKSRYLSKSIFSRANC